MIMIIIIITSIDMKKKKRRNIKKINPNLNKILKMFQSLSFLIIIKYSNILMKIIIIINIKFF